MVKYVSTLAGSRNITLNGGTINYSSWGFALCIGKTGTASTSRSCTRDYTGTVTSYRISCTYKYFRVCARDSREFETVYLD